MRELMNRLWKKEEGFSLIELIIVIAILAIIAAIAVPNLLDNIRKANEGADESNAKLVADAVATVIAQNPTWEGTAFAREPLDGTYVAGATFMDEIMTAAGNTLQTGEPTLKAAAHGTVATPLEVTILADGSIEVFSDTGTQLFPAP